MSAALTLDTQGAVPVRIACVTALRPEFLGTRIGPQVLWFPKVCLEVYTYLNYSSIGICSNSNSSVLDTRCGPVELPELPERPRNCPAELF